jgi:hypothetical protein
MNGKIAAIRQRADIWEEDRPSLAPADDEGFGWAWDVRRMAELMLFPADSEFRSVAVSAEEDQVKVRAVVPDPGYRPDYAVGTVNPVAGSKRLLLTLQYNPHAGAWGLTVDLPDDREDSHGTVTIQHVHGRQWEIVVEPEQDETSAGNGETGDRQ